jgi:hypothetical protein
MLGNAPPCKKEEYSASLLVSWIMTLL